MLEKLFRHKLALSLLSAVTMMLASAPRDIMPAILVTPFLLTALTLQCSGFKQGFKWGFLVSVFTMVLCFYWVTYVIHEFGYLPWSVSAVIFVGFCGIGSLNFPVFVGIGAHLHQKLRKRALPPWWAGVWWTIAFPGLFAITEYAVPKLFPWAFANGLYRTPIAFQIAELTGITFLSFIIFSPGSFLAAWQLQAEAWRPRPAYFAIPVIFWIITLVFGALRLNGPPPDGRQLNVGLIQANIGSLEKVAAERGVRDKVRKVLDRYKALSELSLSSAPKPHLLLWPETAMPFQMENDGLFPTEVKSTVKKWQVPLITGAYAQSPFHIERDYNAAFLLDPTGDTGRSLRIDMYPKNVLLAFGEYMPFGDTFPILYQWFPQVSNFELGNIQKAFTLSDGTRLGMTICYEAIIPSFVRRVARERVHAIVNLTNDSWFGPTSEPYQHAMVAVFRAVEMRVPLIRITNTGVSLVVDDRGRLSDMTGVYKEGVLNLAVMLPKDPPVTFYLRWGEWFIMLSAAILVVMTMVPCWKRK